MKCSHRKECKGRQLEWFGHKMQSASTRLLFCIGNSSSSDIFTKYNPSLAPVNKTHLLLKHGRTQSNLTEIIHVFHCFVGKGPNQLKAWPTQCGRLTRLWCPILTVPHHHHIYHIDHISHLIVAPHITAWVTITSSISITQMTTTQTIACMVQISNITRKHW